MRVRIASRVYNSASQDAPSKSSHSASQEAGRARGTGYDTNIFENADFRNGVHVGHSGAGDGMHVDVGDEDKGSVGHAYVSADEQRVLDRVAEDLARLGRVKRVGLGVEDKVAFCKIWGARKR